MNEAKQLLEKHGLDSTFWGERIILAEENGYFSGYDEKETQYRPYGSFSVVYENDMKILVRNIQPKDKVLDELGMNFSNEIYSGDFLGAAITLVNIEKRAEELIKEYENRIQRIAEYNKVNK
jgi:hypothetical protein